MYPHKSKCEHNPLDMGIQWVFLCVVQNGFQNGRLLHMLLKHSRKTSSHCVFHEVGLSE